jgi:hypothetical protein
MTRAQPDDGCAAAQGGALAGGPHEPVRTTGDPTALLGHNRPRLHPSHRSTICAIRSETSVLCNSVAIAVAPATLRCSPSGPNQAGWLRE